MASAVPEEVEDRIAGGRYVAHLATCSDGKPHIAPLWYRYADGVVEVLTTGQKLANLRRNRNVALSIQADEDGVPRWMVALRGEATVVEDETERREANRRLNRKYGVDEDSWSENTLVRIGVESAAYRTYD